MVVGQSSSLSPHLKTSVTNQAMTRKICLSFVFLPLLTMGRLFATEGGKGGNVCELVAPFATDKFTSDHSLAIRLFSIKSPGLYRTDTGQPFYTAEPLEKLRLSLAEKLREQLQQTKLFRSVVITPDEEAPPTDLVLEGEFTVIYQLGGKVQLMAYPVTRMAIKGKIKASGTSQPVEFSCLSVREAGLVNRPKKQMHKNIERIADGMKKLLATKMK